MKKGSMLVGIRVSECGKGFDIFLPDRPDPILYGTMVQALLCALENRMGAEEYRDLLGALLDDQECEAELAPDYDA